MVQAIASEQEFKDALTYEGLVVVDFFATWCGPCKVISPLIDKFSTEYSNVKFLKVDVDQFGGLAQEYELASMPTVIFIKGGKIVLTVVGANPAGIKQALVANA